jgi:FMN phosphatase YigB (HAD superfamily)
VAVRAVLFDLDQTLWSVGPPPEDWAEITALQSAELAPEFARLHLGHLDVREFVRRFWANWAVAAAQPNPTLKELNGAELICGTLALHGVECSDGEGERLWEALHNVPFHHFNIRRFPDAASTVAALSAAGYRLAVVTNRPTPVSTLARELRGHDIPDVFEAIVTTGEVGYQKPHPLVFETAARRLGVRHGEAVMVGDSYVNDVVPAAALGMMPVMKLNDRAPDPACVLARYQVPSLAALLRLDLFSR